MQNSNDGLLVELKALLKRKKSNRYYAQILGVTETEVEQLKKELREIKETEEVDEEIDKEDSTIDGTIIRHNLEKGSIEIQAYYDHPPQPEEVIADHKIDTELWRLSSYWSKGKAKGWLVSAWFTKITKTQVFQTEFIEFLDSWKSPHKVIEKKKLSSISTNSCLVINKQDAHYNKYDINGNNDITERFSEVEGKVEKILKKAATGSNLQKLIYIIGSDELNSEWTETTTKGTPQQNILGYQTSFQAVCYHEVNVINQLLKYSDSIEVIYIPGNHDNFSGWHIASWLRVYYKDQKNIEIDISPSYTKYVKFSNTAMMFNHGDEMKPEKLAQNFPIEFKEHWSSCDHYFVFTGDKHVELSKSIGGIKFYQVPALSKSKSWWDSRNGYTTTKAEMTAFLIEEKAGMTDIYKEVL